MLKFKKTEDKIYSPVGNLAEQAKKEIAYYTSEVASCNEKYKNE